MTPRRRAKKVLARVRCEERKHATYFAGKHDRCIRYVQGEATRAVHAAMFDAEPDEHGRVHYANLFPVGQP